ncbi:PEP-CTERM sorting domain-containing protein [Roseomonas nepalensis]|uniref:PEP-CTERM sorting domain-containing protein n=2 Tax=Muricoccus nepalensis TaxID=1854500 RepID=A0A502EW64_9PROT|nr:PEP-CTERM sorting domain-containing protein [Roseomonas nepalensis]
MGPVSCRSTCGGGDGFRTPETPNAGLATSREIVISDAAYASGYTFDFLKVDGRVQTNQTAGLLGLTFNYGVENAVLPDFIREQSPFDSALGLYDAVIAIGAAPFSLPSGRIEYSDTVLFFNLILVGANGAGVFDSDAFNRTCGSEADCTYTFTGATTVGVAPTAVPEPASLVVFGAGLLGLAATARQRRTRR